MPAIDAKAYPDRMMGYFSFHQQVLAYIQQYIFFLPSGDTKIARKIDTIDDRII